MGGALLVRTAASERMRLIVERLLFRSLAIWVGVQPSLWWRFNACATTCGLRRLPGSRAHNSSASSAKSAKTGAGESSGVRTCSSIGSSAVASRELGTLACTPLGTSSDSDWAWSGGPGAAVADWASASRATVD